MAPAELTDRQRRILEALAPFQDRGADMWQLGADTQEPPFAVRGELQYMRRLELVDDRLPVDRRPARVWVLTPAGERLLDQGVLL